MIIKSFRLANTAKSIVKEFNENKIHYGLARNYEKFPYFGHDIDFFSNEDSDKLKKILIKVAKKNNWDALTHNTHFRNSINNNGSVEAFHFYKYTKNKYEVLHLDFFRDNIVYGLPIIKSSSIKMSANKKKEYFYINEKAENVIKILQLNSHFSNKHAFQNINIKKKIKLYTKKIINFYKKNKNKNFDNGLLFEKEAIISLQEKKINKFKFYINLSKIIFFIKYFFFNPFKFFLNLFLRLIFFINIFLIRQPGLIIYIYTKDKIQNKNIFRVLNFLQKNNFINNWYIKKNKFIFSFKERKILERSGCILLFTSKQSKNTLYVKKNDTFNDILLIFLRKLIKKNLIIYEKK
jgi:hypothetical protein